MTEALLDFNVFLPMRKYYLFAALIAASSLLFSCAKEIEDANTTDPEQKVYEYIFQISDENQDETKTTLDGSTVAWESGDRIGIFATGTVNKYGAISDLNPVKFPVYLAAALSEGDMVYCYYPQSSTNDSATSDEITLVIPNAQTGDFDAMPQVSIPYETTSDLAKGTTKIADIKFLNLGSVARFLVYSSTGAYSTEIVESITFNADKALAGSFSFDLESVSVDTPSTLTISGYAATSAKITAAPTVGSNTSNAGQANLVIAPGTYYGTVVLVTDKAKYTYTISESNKITFNRSKVKKIGLNLESATCTRVEKHPVDEVFVPATSITAGDKILITSGNSGSIYVMGYQKSTNRDAVSYTSDGSIISTASMYPMSVAAGTTESSYFTLYDSDEDGYLAATGSSNNYLKTNSEVSVDTEWEIILDGDGKATTFAATGSSNRNVMQFNDGSKLFSCYSSASQSAVYVFKKSTVTFVSAADQDVTYATTSIEIPYTVYNASGDVTATWNTNPSDLGTSLTVDSANNKVTFTIPANNTASVRTYKVDITNNGVTKTVIINQAAEPTKLVMSTITATPYENHIEFSWPEVSGATGYAISTNNGVSYDAPQTALTYDWTGLSTLTSYTIYIKAIGDGGIYYSDSEPKSQASTTLAPTLALPASFTWTKATKTISWTDPNTAAGTYGVDYKYVYTLDDGETTTDATTSTTAVLSITVTTNVKIKAVALTTANQSSAFSSNIACNVGDALAGIPVSWPITAGTAPTITSNTFSSTATAVGTATLKLCDSEGTVQTLTTTNAGTGTGVYNSGFTKDWYWLFEIPVENLKSTDNIKIQAGLYNNTSQTYKIYYSTNNSTWTDTEKTIAQTTAKSTAVKDATFTTANIAEGTLYIKLVGGTTTSSRLVKEIGFSVVTD